MELNLKTIVKIHKPGIFCEAAMLRDVLEYYGLSLNGATSFGLSGSMGFSYAIPDTYSTGLPHYTVSGININLTMPLLTNLGLDWDRYNNLKFEECIECFRYYFSKHMPVIIRVSYKEYYSSVFGKEDSNPGSKSANNIFSVFEKYLPYNSGVHFILGIGIDEIRQELIFIENMFFDEKRMPLNILRKAMHSGQKMSEINEFSVIYPFEGLEIRKYNIMLALRKTASNLLEKIDYFGEIVNGINGLRNFIIDFVSWNKKFELKILKEHLALLFLSGGGIFGNDGFYRGTFSKFLNFAYSIIKDERLSLISDKYKVLGGSWYRFLSKTINAVDNDPQTFFTDELSDELLGFYEEEKDSAERLRTFVEDFIDKKEFKE
jgi:hypothetical protein